MRQHWLLVKAALVLLVLSVGFVSAGEVRLKNGLVLEGTPAPVQSLGTVVHHPPNDIVTYPIIMVDTGLQRYFVPARRVLELNQNVDLAQYETFRLEQRRTGPAVKIQSVGAILAATPFDEFGRRRVKLQTPHGPIDVIQGITFIHPKYVTVKSLNYLWQFSMATTSLPPETLNKILYRLIDVHNPQDRLAIARFYLQAGMYMRAQAELDAVRRDFPKLKKQVEELSRQVRELVGEQLASELRRRQRAGQHFLAYTAAKQFPSKNLSGDVLRQVRDLIEEYQRRRDQIEFCKMLLGDLQAQVKKKEWLEMLPAMRSEVSEQLNYETLDRLAAFLQLQSDPGLSAEEKLALAYSGWVVGSANATTDLAAAIRLWKARFLVLQYLRSGSELKRRSLLAALRDVEGVGFETILQMIPLLPPPLEPPSTEAGVPIQVEVESSAEGQNSSFQLTGFRRKVTYQVLLPPEYHPFHRYPAIVALHAAGQPLEKILVWWGGTKEHPLQAQRHGYIVIAPEYADRSQQSYEPSAAAHVRILQALQDARKRFNIDSDRVFLAGHGMGAEAAFDLGMSRPDVFAGVIAVSGAVNRSQLSLLLENVRNLPWYVVCGELDDDLFDRNAGLLNRMLRNSYDLIVTEYVGRGHESFYEEIHKLFDWMDRQRRPALPKWVKVRTRLSVDNRFYWFGVSGFPTIVRVVSTGSSRSGIVSRTRLSRPLWLEARVAPGNTDRNLIEVRSGTKRSTIWLNPQLIDFNKRVTVRLNGKQRWNRFVRPDVETLLEDLRVRGDRQRLFWAKLELK